MSPAAFLVGPHEQRLSVAREGDGTIIEVAEAGAPAAIKRLTQEETVELWYWLGSSIVIGAQERIREAMAEIQHEMEDSLDDRS